MMATPARAPHPASRLKAFVKMDDRAAGSASIWVMIMYSTIRKYAPTIKGTRTVATAAIRFRPPSTTALTMPAMLTPIISFIQLTSIVAPALMAVEHKASVSWLAFMMHSVPNIPAMAKHTASHRQLAPSPRVMMCIGPPA